MTTPRAAPSRRTAERRAPPRSSLVRRGAATVGLALRRRPGRWATMTVAALAIGSVVWNTLLHQTAHHPAPLFGPGASATPGRTATLPQPPTLPPPLPAPRPDAATVGSLGPVRPPEPAAARPKGQDPIGDLIRTGEPPPPRGAEPSRPDGSGRVATAQQALSKLGYGPLKPDGRYGATTRSAVERFERDRGLAVTGVLAGATVRRLAQLSGLAIE